VNENLLFYILCSTLYFTNHNLSRVLGTWNIKNGIEDFRSIFWECLILIYSLAEEAKKEKEKENEEIT
jgi:hypothetical protein